MKGSKLYPQVKFRTYQRNYSYADDLFWHTVMDAIRVLYQTVYAERNGTHD